MASASALYDELAAAKIKLLGTTRPGPGMGLWAQQTNERLMSLIEGKWIDLGYSDLTSEDNMNKYCDKFGESFKKLTDYSFDIIGPITRSKHAIHREYIFRTGISYNYRWNIEQQMEVLGRGKRQRNSEERQRDECIAVDDAQYHAGDRFRLRTAYPLGTLPH